MSRPSFTEWKAQQAVQPSEKPSFSEWKAQQQPAQKPSFTEWKAQRAEKADEPGIGPASLPHRIMQTALSAGQLEAQRAPRTPLEAVSGAVTEAEGYGRGAAINQLQREGKRPERQAKTFKRTVKSVAENMASGDKRTRDKVQRALEKNKVRQMGPPSFDPEQAVSIDIDRPVAKKPKVEVKSMFPDMSGPAPDVKPPKPRDYETGSIDVEERPHIQLVQEEAEGKTGVGRAMLEEPTEGKSFTEIAMTLLDTPFRGVAGLAKGGQESLRWLANNYDKIEDMETAHKVRDVLTRHMFNRAKRSLTAEDPVHFIDVNAEAISALKGDQPLTRGEMAFAGGLGLVQDLVAGSWAFPRIYRGPKGPVVAKQMKNALKGAGVAAEDIARFSNAGRRLADWALEKSSHPKQFATALRELRKLAKKYGVDPKMTERLMLEQTGVEGAGFGLKGLRRGYAVGTSGNPEMVALGRQSAIPGPVPRGARQGGVVIPGMREVAGEIKYGAGAAKGARDALRKYGGTEGVGMYEARRGGKEARRLFGKRGEYFMRMRDAKSKLAQERRLLDDIDETTIEGMERADEIRAGTSKALDDLGLSREDVAAGYQYSPGKRGLRERQGIVGFSKAMRDLDRRAREMGIDMGHIEHYVPYIETKAGRNQRLKELVSGVDESAQAGFVKERMPHEVGISLGAKAGKKAKPKFETNPARIYALRRKAQAIAEAQVTAEKSILGGYAREVPDSWYHPPAGGKAPKLRGNIADELKDQDLTIYHARHGPFAGKKYVVDRMTGNLLHRLTKPKGVDKALKRMEKMHGWWKGRTLLNRLGYTVRNKVSNEFQLWMADTDLARSAADASYLMSKRLAERSPMGVGSITKDTFAKIMRAAGGKDILKGGKPTRFGKYTADEALELAEEYGIFRGGQVTEELFARGGMSGEYSLNPASRNFAPLTANGRLNQFIEEFDRLRVFTDKLRKGFSPEEATEYAARYMFNYDELSRSGMIALRQIMPFGTWPYKAIGQQATELVMNPRKMGQFLRTAEGLEQMDPLDRKQYMIEQAMGPAKGHKMIFRMPGARGDEGEREYGIIGNFLPPPVLNIAMPERIGAELSMMLSPVAEAVLHLKEIEEQETFPGYWGNFRRSNTNHLASVPESLETMLGYAEENHPAIYKALTRVFEPAVDPMQRQRLVSQAKAAGLEGDAVDRYVDQHARTMGHKWDRDFYEAWQKIDPATNQWIARLFKSDDERTKDELLNWLIGFKLREYGEREADVDWRREQAELQKEISGATKEAETLGRKIDPERPFGGFY